MDDIGFEMSEQVLNRDVCGHIVMGVYLPAEVIENHKLKRLIFGLLIEVAFRPQRRACNQRHIVASLGQQLAGY